MPDTSPVMQIPFDTRSTPSAPLCPGCLYRLNHFVGVGGAPDWYECVVCEEAWTPGQLTTTIALLD